MGEKIEGSDIGLAVLPCPELQRIGVLRWLQPPRYRAVS